VFGDLLRGLEVVAIVAIVVVLIPIANGCGPPS
jgi:hypothetical protein